MGVIQTLILYIFQKVTSNDGDISHDSYGSGFSGLEYGYGEGKWFGGVGVSGGYDAVPGHIYVDVGGRSRVSLGGERTGLCYAVGHGGSGG